MHDHSKQGETTDGVLEVRTSLQHLLVGTINARRRARLQSIRIHLATAMTPADSLAEQQLPPAVSAGMPPQPLPLPHLRLPAGKHHSTTVHSLLHVLYGVVALAAHRQLRWL